MSGLAGGVLRDFSAFLMGGFVVGWFRELTEIFSLEW